MFFDPNGSSSYPPMSAQYPPTYPPAQYGDFSAGATYPAPYSNADPNSYRDPMYGSHGIAPGMYIPNFAPSAPSMAYGPMGHSVHYHQYPQAGAPYQPPTTYQPVPPVPGPAGRRKKALLIGCCYPGTENKLNGCINDVQCMQYLLKSKFGYDDSGILLLRDDVQSKDFTSTRHNINAGMMWLMAGIAPGDSVFFHYSGHGGRTRDLDGDEEDGFDETICPSDFQSAGMIVDDELNRKLINPIPHGATFHAVIDACHSGTMLDLEATARLHRHTGHVTWEHRPVPNKGTAGGFAVQFGACRDFQVAQDTNRMSGKVYTGAATFSFIEAIERHGPNQTYEEILVSMTQHLATGASSTFNGISTGATLGSADALSNQQPVLSATLPFDLKTTRLLM